MDVSRNPTGGPAPRYGLSGSVLRAIVAGSLAGFLAIRQMVRLYPGLASYDAVFAYDEFRHGAVTDWHPPILIRLWSLLESIGLTGTAPLFLLQLALFWIGLGALAQSRARRGAIVSAAAVLAIGIFAPVVGTLDTVIKDAQMIAALTGATGLAAIDRLSGRPPDRAVRIVAAILLAYATLLRANAVFATAPLAFLLFDDRRRAWLGVAAIVLLALSAPVLNRVVLRAAPGRAERSLMLFDLAGIAEHADLPTIPGVAPETWHAAVAAGCYHPIGWDGFSQSPACAPIWADMRRRSLQQAWIAAIVRHPIAYAEHRLQHLNMTLRFIVPPGEPRGTGQGASTPNPYGLGGNPRRARKLWEVEDRVSRQPAGWPIVWLGGGLMLLWSAWRMPRVAARPVLLTILASALILEASFAFVSVASDLRYHLWPIVAIGLAGAIMLGEPHRGRALLRVAGAVIVLGAIGQAARAALPPHWPPWF